MVLASLLRWGKISFLLYVTVMRVISYKWSWSMVEQFFFFYFKLNFKERKDKKLNQIFPYQKWRLICIFLGLMVLEQSCMYIAYEDL